MPFDCDSLKSSLWSKVRSEITAINLSPTPVMARSKSTQHLGSDIILTWIRTCMQERFLSVTTLERSYHADLRIQERRSAEPKRLHIGRYLSRSFGLAIANSNTSSLPHNTTSHTRLLGRRYSPSRHAVPHELLLGQATCLRCRVLDEPLAMPWCQNLACNTVMWRS